MIFLMGVVVLVVMAFPLWNAGMRFNELRSRMDELELQVWRLEAIAEQSAVLERWEGSR